ncbi:MAG: ubiquinone/menaquinone biosynthesis methyltransferase [bacterium]|nr:MAG: ubiquinone/menaquinone biosynthesis methyltransferase [bacterium]
MFADVPDTYDLVNRLVTFRRDEAWRSMAARRILRDGPKLVLDLGCGTGDLFRYLGRGLGDGKRVVGADFSAPMLQAARRKVLAAGIGQQVRLVCADAADLSFPDDSFDAVGLAFSFRNLVWRNPHRDRYLAEIHRVLRPGGKVVIVESSRPRWRPMGVVFDGYLRLVVPVVGGWLSGARGAYRYLSESARSFHSPEELSSLLSEAGFRRVGFRRLLGGVAGLHEAQK